MATVHFEDDKFTISCPNWDARAKSAPQSNYHARTKQFNLSAIEPNAQYIRQEFTDDELSAEAKIKTNEIIAASRPKPKPEFPAWFKFKNEPRSHQIESLHAIYKLHGAALFMEMRTGKSFVAICDAVAHAQEGHIEAMVVICLTTNKPVWELQLEEHCPIPYNAHIIYSGYTGTAEFIKSERDEFPVLIIGVEALSQGKANSYLQQFLHSRSCALYIDESDTIKNPKSIRTERCIEAGNWATYRRILTGTEITQGIEDLYAQFRFLDWKIIGIKSYYAFKARYCVEQRFDKFTKIVGYINIADLMRRLTPYVYRCLAKDVIDLPPQVFEQRIVEPNPEQKRLMAELGDPLLMATNIDEHTLDVETVLERMIRYQQISGGHFPFDADDGGYDVMTVPGTNPKLSAMQEDIGHIRSEDKIIIWAEFRPEITLIVDWIRENYGKNSYVEYHGGTDQDSRKEILQSFQSNPDIRFFITNKTGKRGLELSAASVHLFYSNSFSYSDRQQAMARTNSSKQTKSVLYIDYILNHRIDKMIHAALEKKKSMADYVKDKLQ